MVLLDSRRFSDRPRPLSGHPIQAATVAAAGARAAADDGTCVVAYVYSA